MSRDDFSRKVKEIVKGRSAYICSNPDCRRLTIAPSEADSEKFLYVGMVAHITAAAPGGPRYEPNLTEEERASSENAIHLCAVCATMIDKNQGIDFSKELLKRWKTNHEEWVTKNLNKNPWFANFKDEARFEFVRKMVSLAKQYTAQFSAATSFLTYDSEYADREKKENELQGETLLLNEAFARKGRLTRLRETLIKLYEMSWEAEIVVGQDISELIQPFDYAFKELWATIEAYFSTKLERERRGGWGNPEMDIWLKSCHEIIYGINTQLAQSVIDAGDKLVEKLNSF